ncbi:MAG: hypothetical protein ABIR81_08355 [Ginsengibacter sp.]
MQKQSVNTNNKSIDWTYLPDEQLAGVVSKFPFYTKANAEVFNRIQKYNNQNLVLLKDRTALYAFNANLFQGNIAIKQKNDDNHDKNLVTNILERYGTSDISAHAAVLPEINSLDGSVLGELVVPIEPLHTVDYFLSQGIKVTDETASTDKLGTQLKSFTDWLKSMKKVHTQRLELQSENTDKIIQSIAEHSNEAAGVETEAMAEVLTRQGKRLQALEIYQKLSLKNPAESAYFAAKIQSLKQA